MKRVFKEKEGISKYLEKLRPVIDKIIEKYLPKKANKKWLKFSFDKPNYSYSLRAAQKALVEPAWEILGRGGKRWRPALFLLITQALGGNVKKVKDFAIIPELIHEGSLCVDDVEDNSELRRGKPCLHKIFGVDLAINLGNFLYFFPLLLFVKNRKKFKPEILIRAYEIYIEEMCKLHFGQGTDIFWHQGKEENIKEKEYLQMCAFKTGGLARMAAKMAAILAGGREELAEKLGKLAESLGVAFQIQDDILDISLSGKEREKFGKAFGNDIKEGKRSLLVIYTLKKASKREKKRLLEILNKHTDDQKEKEEAIAIIKKYGGVEYAQKKSKEILEKAWQEIEEFLPPSRAKEKLKNFVFYLTTRKQ